MSSYAFQRIRRLRGLPQGPRRSTGLRVRGSSFTRVLAAVAILGLSAAFIVQGLRTSRAVRHYEATQASLREEVAEARKTGEQGAKAGELRDAEIDRLKSATREIYVLRAQASELLRIRDENLRLREELMRLKAQATEQDSQAAAGAEPPGTPSAETSADDTARIWDVQTGQQLLAITGIDYEFDNGLRNYFNGPFNSTNRITRAFFSPDGTRLVTGVHAGGGLIVYRDVPVQSDGANVDYPMLRDERALQDQLFIYQELQDGEVSTESGTTDVLTPDE